MSRINECEGCLEGPTRETEFYEDLGALEGQYPLLCWRCGYGAKLEQERIIKLLESQRYPNGSIDTIVITSLIALIKGERTSDY